MIRSSAATRPGPHPPLQPRGCWPATFIYSVAWGARGSPVTLIEFVRNNCCVIIRPAECISLFGCAVQAPSTGAGCGGRAWHGMHGPPCQVSPLLAPCPAAVVTQAEGAAQFLRQIQLVRAPPAAGHHHPATAGMHLESAHQTPVQLASRACNHASSRSHASHNQQAGSDSQGHLTPVPALRGSTAHPLTPLSPHIIYSPSRPGAPPISGRWLPHPATAPSPPPSPSPPWPAAPFESPPPASTAGGTRAGTGAGTSTAHSSSLADAAPPLPGLLAAWLLEGQHHPCVGRPQ